MTNLCSTRQGDKLRRAGTASETALRDGPIRGRRSFCVGRFPFHDRHQDCVAKDAVDQACVTHEAFPDKSHPLIERNGASVVGVNIEFDADETESPGLR
jgi:hypothetical protein